MGSEVSKAQARHRGYLFLLSMDQGVEFSATSPAPCVEDSGAESDVHYDSLAQEVSGEKNISKLPRFL